MSTTARMPFGKYRGTPLDSVPTSYLAWLLDDERTIDRALRTSVRDELADRLGLAPAPLQLPAPSADVHEAATALIAAGYRAAAKQAHPDTGGSHALMLSLSAAREWLERAVGAA